MQQARKFTSIGSLAGFALAEILLRHFVPDYLHNIAANTTKPSTGWTRLSMVASENDPVLSGYV